MNRTIPQIEAILDNLPEQLSMKLGIPYKPQPKAGTGRNGSGSTAQDLMDIAAQFNGIGS